MLTRIESKLENLMGLSAYCLLRKKERETYSHHVNHMENDKGINSFYQWNSRKKIEQSGKARVSQDNLSKLHFSFDQRFFVQLCRLWL